MIEKSMIEEMKKNPEKLRDFLENFDIDTLAGTVKGIILDYCKENTDSRSLLLLFETDEQIMASLIGRNQNIINSILSATTSCPELQGLIQTAALMLETFKRDKKIEVIPNKIKS